MLMHTRAGDAMEHGLRECCKSIHIGHILIQHDASKSAPQVAVSHRFSPHLFLTARRKVYYAKLPSDVGKRLVLLLNPIIGTSLFLPQVYACPTDTRYAANSS